MFVLFKWLLWLCMPFTLALLGLAAVGLWLLWRRQARPALCVLLLDALLVAMSLPAVPTALGSMLERKFPSVALKDIPKADAIVVLGGGVGAAREGLPYPECYPASDRAVMAARLFHAGKAPLIIPTGEGAPEAEKPLLEAMRVPAAAILCEDAARDTAENASKTFALLRARGCKKVLVVTSAWHLPRTMMLFKASGMEFVPVGCDYEATLAALEAPRSPLWQKLPSAQAAAQTGVYLKEWLGILFYSFRKPTEGQKEGLKDGGAEGRKPTPKRKAAPRKTAAVRSSSSHPLFLRPRRLSCASSAPLEADFCASHPFPQHSLPAVSAWPSLGLSAFCLRLHRASGAALASLAPSLGVSRFRPRRVSPPASARLPLGLGVSRPGTRRGALWGRAGALPRGASVCCRRRVPTSPCPNGLR